MVGSDLIARFHPNSEPAAKNCLRVGIVGGGPAGLLLAWKLLDAGHQVEVFEKQGPYDLNRPLDPRSYNVTADGLGMRAFGALRGLIYCVGRIVDGRAVHRPPSATWTHHYGDRASDYLISVGRGDLLALLAASLGEHPRCTMHFGCEATDADVKHNKGAIHWKRQESDATEICREVDLIVFADGLHGLGRKKAWDAVGVNAFVETEQTPYLKATIGAEVAASIGLELDKIHFFPSATSLGIGLPNQDGTISVLIEAGIQRAEHGQELSPFTGKQWTWHGPVFTSPKEAESFIHAQNGRLYQALPDFAEQVVNLRAGHFCRTHVNRWRVGQVGVLVGDAGSCAPPWAGFGMNLACSHASDLAMLVERCSDLNTALDQYDWRRRRCSDVVHQIVQEHGELLNSGMGTWQWRREQTLRERREQVLGERTNYQIVAFEPDGLERLAGLAD